MDGPHAREQKHSRLMIALLDGKRGLRRFRDTGEYDDRIDLLESALEDAPSSHSGMLPALKRESEVGTDLDELLRKIKRLQEECQQIDHQNPADDRIERMISLINDLRDGIESL